MLCSMDAMWRVFGYQTYPAPYPTVIQVKVKLPAQLLLIQNEQKLCDLLVYLARPQTVEFEQMLYTEFFKEWKYGYEKNIPLKHKNKLHLERSNADSGAGLPCVVQCVQSLVKVLQD